jgi:GNAT superfamily N-acetyltransferase
LCWLCKLFVQPNFWRVGIGRRLTQTLIREARLRGYHRAQLWTDADNRPARSLYERLGFRPSGLTTLRAHGRLGVHYVLPDFSAAEAAVT